MTFAPPNRTRAGVSLSAAALSAWVARASPGERLVYHRGALALDRSKATDSLKEVERRKLATVADHVLALAGRGELHLLQKRHGDGDYSYFAVARGSARSVEQVPSHLSLDQHRERPRL